MVRYPIERGYTRILYHNSQRLIKSSVALFQQALIREANSDAFTIGIADFRSNLKSKSSYRFTAAASRAAAA
jgi:hypothetical protein